MIHDIEQKSQKELVEIVKIQQDEYKKVLAENTKLEKERESAYVKWQEKYSELKAKNSTLDNQLHELYHAMELISKIATVIPRDTAILEVINCYRTGELLQSHNLEQQARALSDYAYGGQLTKRGLNLKSIELTNQAKELKGDL